MSMSPSPTIAPRMGLPARLVNQPSGAEKLLRPDVEVLEVHDHRVRQVGRHRAGRILVHAEEVADVERGHEVLPVHRLHDPPDPVAALDEEAVVLQAGGDALGLGVVGDLLAGGHDGAERLLEDGGVVTGHGGVGDHVVPHQPDSEAVGQIDEGLHPRDLGVDFGGVGVVEGCPDRQVGQRHAPIVRVLPDRRRELGRGVEVGDRAVGPGVDGGEFEVLTVAVGDPVDHVEQGHLAAGETLVEAVGTEAELHERPFGARGT